MRTRNTTVLLLLLLAAAAIVAWYLRRGPGRFNAGVPADEQARQVERDDFLARFEDWRAER